MAIFTVGHSIHSAGKFIEMLEANKIQVLVDVRSKPYSRSPHFNQRYLTNMVEFNAIEYQYKGDILGGFSELPVSDPTFVKKMEEVLAIGETRNVAMMCSEKNPAECHRSYKLTAWMHRNTDLNAVHIMPDGVNLPSRPFEQMQLQKQLCYWFKEETTQPSLC